MSRGHAASGPLQGRKEVDEFKALPRSTPCGTTRSARRCVHLLMTCDVTWMPALAQLSHCVKQCTNLIDGMGFCRSPTGFAACSSAGSGVAGTQWLVPHFAFLKASDFVTSWIAARQMVILSSFGSLRPHVWGFIACGTRLSFIFSENDQSNGISVSLRRSQGNLPKQ